MDRITKAIELAKEKNLAAAGVQAANVDPATVTKVNHSVARAETVAVDENLLRKSKIMSFFDDAQSADAYRLLRTRVLQRMRQNNWNTLGITSTHPKAGKSLTAINLSIAISMDSSYSSLLVDADLRRPSVADYFGLDITKGIGAYLTGDTPTSELLITPGIEDFAVLPCEAGQSGASELMNSPKMTRFVEQTKKGAANQITVFDLPPILVGDDVLSFSSHLDDGVTERPDIQHALHLLKDTQVLGCVLNKSAEAKSTSYGGYY